MILCTEAEMHHQGDARYGTSAGNSHESCIVLVPEKQNVRDVWGSPQL